MIHDDNFPLSPVLTYSNTLVLLPLWLSWLLLRWLWLAGFGKGNWGRSNEPEDDLEDHAGEPLPATTTTAANNKVHVVTQEEFDRLKNPDAVATTDATTTATTTTSTGEDEA